MIAGEAERHELVELFAGDFADGGFMDELRVNVLCVKGRGGKNGALILKNGVAFGVATTGVIALDMESEFLARFVGCNRAGNDVGDGIFAV